MKLRELSSVETFFYSRSNINLHSCFYVGVQLNIIPSKSQLIKALHLTISQFPLLHCNVSITDPITNTDVKPYINSINEPIGFDDVVIYQDWDILGEEENNYIFKTFNFPYHENKPLWKLLIIPKTKQILLLVDHLYADGMSTVNFWMAFIQSLNSDTEITIDSDVVFHSEHEFQIPAHPYDKWPIPWLWKTKRFIVSKLFNWNPQLIVAPDSNLLHFKNYTFPKSLLLHSDEEDSSKKFKVRNDNHQYLLNIPTDQLKQLLSVCKEHSVSLTSYIAALYCISITKVKKDCYDGSHIKIDVPMNTRATIIKTLDIPPKELQFGNYIAGIELLYDLKENKDIWGIATEIQKQLLEHSTTGISDLINNMKLLDVIDPEVLIRSKVTPVPNTTKYPGSTFEVTNLGNQDFNSKNDASAEFWVEDALFNEPQGISDIFTCSTISTPKGGLNFCISYPDDIKDDIGPCMEYFKKNVLDMQK